MPNQICASDRQHDWQVYAAHLAKIRISRDFARCKVVGVVIEAIRHNNYMFSAPAEKVELPAAWLGSSITFKFEDDKLTNPTKCSRPELKYYPYHVFLLLHVESSLRTTLHSTSFGPARKKARMATASAFEEEVESPLLATSKSKRPQAARTFLDTHVVDASKLELLKSVDVAPTFDSFCKSICVTYDLLEVAAIRMKAVTAVTLQMKMTLAQAETTIRRAEGIKAPRSRRGLMSPNYVEKGYFDEKFETLFAHFQHETKSAAGKSDSVSVPEDE